jgi:subtilisin family serine protease
VHRLASGRNVTIAVIDSEIDVTHPDLRGVIIDRFDATQSASKPHTHGTGMAGAIASRFRLLGVAPGVRIIAIKAFDESATSAEATSFQILKGLDYAINKNVRIINMSFAGPRDPMMERTLKSAHDKGTILIAAAGNAGPKSPPLYPGADQSVIAVSATDFNDKPFVMANRGKYIAVAAPGVDVMVPAPGNGYQLTTGTSVAAAHVSGVAALLDERKPTITPDEVRAILMKTATAFSSKPKGEEDGAGLVDPAGALQILAAGAKTSETVPKSTVH